MNLLEEFFLESYPNPERIGCPPEEVLDLLAHKKLAINHPARAHLASCSECFAEYQAFKSGASPPSAQDGNIENGSDSHLQSSETARSSVVKSEEDSRRWVAPAPAKKVATISPNVVPNPANTQVTLGTLQSFSRRLQLSDRAKGEQALPIGMVDVVITLGLSHTDGPCRVVFSQNLQDFSALISTVGVVHQEKGQKVVRILADLRTFRSGAATLTITSVHPEKTETHPILIQDAP